MPNDSRIRKLKQDLLMEKEHELLFWRRLALNSHAMEERPETVKISRNTAAICRDLINCLDSIIAKRMKIEHELKELGVVGIEDL